MRSAPTPLDFSRAQIENLKTRNELTQKMLTVTDAISNAHVAIPVRIAGERNRQYVLIKNDSSQGGGWVLGVRDGASAEVPVKLDASVGSSENESGDEFDEVFLPNA